MECQLGVSRDTDQGVYSSGALERYKRFQVPRSLGKEVTQALATKSTVIKESSALPVLLFGK